MKKFPGFRAGTPATLLSRSSVLRPGMAAGLLAMISTVGVLGQSGAGSIQGTIKDATGAVIPKAAVHVVRASTNEVFDTVSNGEGFFTAPNLFAGEYDITVISEGMSTYKSRIVVQAAQTAVVEPRLSVGTSSTVDVVGDVTPLTDVQDQTIATTLDNQRIQQLPVNGRDIGVLVFRTTPGFDGSPAGGSLRVNGNQSFAFAFVQDGAPLENQDIGGIPGRPPDPDTIQEVRVETANSSAKFNRPATGILTTKSGTNSFHGTLFETARNNSLGIAKARGTATNIAPKYIRNEFGGTFGGPITIPHLYDGKEKAFFFIAFERLSLRQGQPQSIYVPTAAMRMGDFSGLTNSNGQVLSIYDPATTDNVGVRQQASFGGKLNAFDPARISPLAKTLYAITPAPTNTANPYLAPNYFGTTPTFQNSPTITGRLDYRFNQNNNVYLRGTDSVFKRYSLNPDRAPGYGPPTTDLQSNLTVNPAYVYSGAMGFNHIFSPSFYSETVVGNTWETETVVTGINPGASTPTTFGLPNNFNSRIYPLILGAGIGNAANSLLTAYSTADNNRNNVTIQTSIDENLTLIRGRHQMTFGGRYRHDRIGIFPDQSPNPSTTMFSGLGTAQLQNTGGVPSSGTSESAQPLSGLATADFFLGSASQYQASRVHQYYHFRQQEISSYFQDDFHVTPNLTLNLGLRYEIHPAVHEADHSVAGFDLATKTILLGEPLQRLISTGQAIPSVVAQEQALGARFAYAGDVGRPLDVVNGNFANFAPRIGFAWKVFGDRHSTVLRGGFGHYFYPTAVRNFYASARATAPYQATFSTDLTNASTSPDGLPNYLLRSPQTIIAGQNSSNAVNSADASSITPGLTVSSIEQNLPAEYARQTNFTIEQQLKGRSALRLSYLQNDGVNLPQYWEYNTAPPAIAYYLQTNNPTPSGYYSGVARNVYDNRTYGTVEQLRGTGYNHDYSFQANFQRLYANGYSFQIFYVFSAAFRNGDNGFRDSFVYPLASFTPGAVNFTSQDDENHRLNYVRDVNIPKHRIRGNFIYDLPLGKGKRFLGNSNGFVDALLGGFQLAGYYEFRSTLFQPSPGLYGPMTAPFKLYKHGQKVQDCANGVCSPGYLWYNGFIAPARRNNSTNGVSGLPTDYTPYQTYFDMNTASVNYLTNNRQFKLNDGSTVNTTVNPGPGNIANPFYKTTLAGPNVYSFDGSLYKVFHLTEKAALRANVDVFNLFNVQGDVLPDTLTGIQYTLRAAANTPRQIQLSVKLVF